MHAPACLSSYSITPLHGIIKSAGVLRCCLSIPVLTTSDWMSQTVNHYYCSVMSYYRGLVSEGT